MRYFSGGNPAVVCDSVSMRRFLRFLGGLCAALGGVAWIALVWEAGSDLDGVTPQSDGGGHLMGRALTGTLLMIAGMVILHLAAETPEQEEERRRRP